MLKADKRQAECCSSHTADPASVPLLREKHAGKSELSDLWTVHSPGRGVKGISRTQLVHLATFYFHASEPQGELAPH